MPRYTERYTEAAYHDPDQIFWDTPKIADYKIKVVPLRRGPAWPEEYYWHLFFRGDKVNGGICATENQAYDRAGLYRTDHHRILFLEKYVFDTETSNWIRRDSLNI